MVSLARTRPSLDLEFSVVQVLCAPERDSLVAYPVPVLEVDIGGVIGDRHYGVTQASDSRQQRYYPRGTVIRNRRQLTLVSAEELAEVARRLDVPQIRGEWLGANVVVEGMPDFSALPIGTRLLFPGGAGLVCEGVNQPCRLPAEVIQQQFPSSHAVAQFVRAAFGRRGIAASVECPGQIRSRDQGVAFPPKVHAGYR
jgi:hypothetical protein